MLRRISRALSRRLDRIADIVDGWKAARDQGKEAQRARALFLGLLCGGLRDARIDPATVPAMRRFDEPESPADPPVHLRPPDVREQFFANLARLARRCREHPPALAVASPMQLFAMYCFDDSLVSQAKSE
jgi:hypothetical protein